MRRTLPFRLLPLLLLVGAAPAAAQPVVPMRWTPVDSLQARLPETVRVYAGRNDTLPLRAWYVRLDAEALRRTDVVVSDDTTDRRETTSSFARDLGACVAVNGGYFAMGEVPSRHVGLLALDGRVAAPATPEVVRDSLRYPIARAALGFAPDGTPAVAWATSAGDTVRAWPAPPAHRPGAPAPWPDGPGAVWAVEDALAAGPLLLRGGRLHVTDDEEGFFGTAIPATHPRTAAGVTADGALVLMVVDGRQDASRGVDLDELAVLLRDVGAVDALNLDGGGSSTLVVDGVLLNRPTGGTVEREVMSALVTRCR